jgi:hypothetical protein
MPSKRKVYHLVPNKEQKVWKGKEEGAKRAVVVNPNKENALNELTQIAKNQPPSQVKIHKKDGTIQDEHTYGQDPRNYPG